MRGFALILFFAASVALSQTVVTANQGKPGTQGPWPVTSAGSNSTDAGSTLVATAAHGACTNRTQNVGTSSIPCPGDGGSATGQGRSDRATVLIQLVQSGETLTITEDTTAASATSGIAIGSGGTFSDNLKGSIDAQCRCTAATCSVRTVECPAGN